LNSVAASKELEHIAALPFLGDNPIRHTMRRKRLEPENARNRQLPHRVNEWSFRQNPAGIVVVFINPVSSGPERTPGQDSTLQESVDQLQFGRE